MKSEDCHSRTCSGHPRAEHALRRGQKARGSPGRAHGCPAHFVLYDAHGTVCIRVWTLGTFRDTKGDNAVRHQNTVFHTVLKHLPWDEFERLVKVHGADEDES